MCQYCKKSEDDTRCICQILAPDKFSFLAIIEADEREAAKDYLHQAPDYRNLNKELFLSFNKTFKKEFKDDRKPQERKKPNN